MNLHGNTIANSDEDQAWTGIVRSIGIIHSPFFSATGTPVQNYAARSHGEGLPETSDFPEAVVRDVNGGRGTIEVSSEWESAITDLAEYDRIWVLFWIDRASEAKPMVLPYRDTKLRGLFATRAPARPNPIGISCVKLLGVTGRFLHVGELDILDGSPLLDLKPYVTDYDCFPGASRGWLDDAGVKSGPMVADGRFESTNSKGSV